MLRKITLLIVLVFPFVVHAEITGKEVEQYDDKSFVVEYSQDGRVVANGKFDKDGNLVSLKGQVLDGDVVVEKMNGFKEIEPFRKGTINGIKKGYKDGVLVYEEAFMNGLAHGKGKRYDDKTGNLSMEFFSEKGKVQGDYITYYQNGQINEKVAVKSGIFHGMYLGYYENGQIKLEMPYIKGLLHGMTTMYYENGQVKGIETYRDGDAQGIHLVFYENGKIKGYTWYKDDKAHGLAVFFYKNGNVEGEIFWFDDKRHGLEKWYYENGRLESSCEYVKGQKHGLCHRYADDKQNTLLETKKYMTDLCLGTTYKNKAHALLMALFGALMLLVMMAPVGLFVWRKLKYPNAEMPFKEEPNMSLIKGALAGKKPLWKSFWLLWGVGCFFAGIAGGVLGVLILLVVVQDVVKAFVGAVFFCVVVQFIFSVLSAVCVWRCSFNTTWRVWGYLARLFVVAYFVILILAILFH